MPYPKNDLKLTGSTSPPNTALGLDLDDETLDGVVVEEIQVYADGWEPEEPRAAEAPRGAFHAMEQKVEQLPARHPWLAIGSGLILGWLVARMLRR